MNTLSERIKLGLLCLLLLFMLGILAFTAVNTFQAACSFQQQYSAIKHGDVASIHPWMTIHMIAHIYHVPEDYLYHALHLNTHEVLRHVTLYDLAHRKQLSLDHVIHTLQHAILAYRKEHLHSFTPVPTLRTPRKLRSLPPERMYH